MSARNPTASRAAVSLPARTRRAIRSPLLGVDDRAQYPLELRVQPAHERVGVVEAAAVDADDDLRSRSLERLPLQLLDRFAANLAVEVSSAGTTFETGERRLVRGPDKTMSPPRRAARAGSAIRRGRTALRSFEALIATERK